MSPQAPENGQPGSCGNPWLLLRQSAQHESPQVLLHNFWVTFNSQSRGAPWRSEERKINLGDGAHGRLPQAACFPSKSRRPPAFPSMARQGASRSCDAASSLSPTSPQKGNSQITHQESTVSGLSHCKRQDTTALGSADGKLSTGHLAGMVCWSSTAFFFLFT